MNIGTVKTTLSRLAGSGEITKRGKSAYGSKLFLTPEEAFGPASEIKVFPHGSAKEATEVAS